MSEITTTDLKANAPIPRYLWLGLAAFVVFAYFFGLSIPLVGPDEPRYAQVAREMWQRGDWVTPTLGGHNWFEKPALLYWLEIAAYNMFGVTEFAARFGSAIFGLGTILSLWILGRHLTPDYSVTDGQSTPETSDRPNAEDQRSKTHFAHWLALIAASTLGIIVFARGASFDIVVTFPITAALTGYFLFDQRRGESFVQKYLPLICFYFFIGIALLAKGLIGIVFPFAIVGLYHVASRRLPSGALLISLIWGTLISAAAAATWYWPMYQQHGYEFIDEFFIQHHFQRFTSNKYQHPQPFFFFFWVLPLMTLPWMPFFLASVLNGIRGLLARRDAETQSSDVSPSDHLGVAARPLLLFSLSWLVVPLLFFSMSGSKLPGYILPSVPAAIIVTSFYVYSLVSKSRRWRNALFAAAPATLLIGVALLIFAVPRFADSDSVKSLIETAAARGHTTEQVLMLHTISHNAEFYAAGRILRDETGKQKRLFGVADVWKVLQENGAQPVLVLVPLEYLPQLVADKTVTSEVLKDNGELAIVYVTEREASSLQLLV